MRLIGKVGADRVIDQLEARLSTGAKDSGFADDVVKTNLAKILEQSGIEPDNIRSL